VPREEARKRALEPLKVSDDSVLSCQESTTLDVFGFCTTPYPELTSTYLVKQASKDGKQLPLN
jgi:hypothetical protein